MDKVPKPGEFYRHFKNTFYQIVAIAQHTETGEELVIYQALYGDFRVYARPLSMFLSEVDRKKYPDANQKYRFEQVVFVREEEEDRRMTKQGMNPWLERFLDAKGYDQQIEVLSRMRGNVGQKELDSIYLALDISMPFGSEDVDSQLRGIIKHLETRKKYDGSRLR